MTHQDMHTPALWVLLMLLLLLLLLWVLMPASRRAGTAGAVAACAAAPAGAAVSSTPTLRQDGGLIVACPGGEQLGATRMRVYVSAVWNTETRNG